MLQGIYDFFAKPIGWLLAQMCAIFGGNFALSIFIFTLIMNVIFMPLNIKQQKSMASQARMKNKMDKIKEKYKDDKAAQQQAMGELMQESGSNPMSGCLLMFIRLPFFVAIYTAVQRPLTFLLGASKELIEAAQKTLSVKSEMAVLENIEKLEGSEIFDLATDINFDFLYDMGLSGEANSKEKRLWLCEKLGIGYVNSKQLLNRLNLFGFTKEYIMEVCNGWKC